MTPFKIALVIQQCRVNAFEANLTACIDAVHRAGKEGAGLVVFPEMNLTGYSAGDTRMARPVETYWLSRLFDAAQANNTTILAGLAESGPNDTTYASHLIVQPKNRCSIYRKTHLSPFEQNTYTQGDDVRVFGFKGVKFGVQLCYDAHFPALSTAMALKGADVIILPHASPRGSCEDKLNSWMRHLPARAFDNGLFVAAVNQAGDNGAGLHFPGIGLVIGPDGYRISAHTGEGIHLVDLDMTAVHRVRSHKMRYFLPNRRPEILVE